MELDKILVIIPALNEEATIAAVVETLQAYGLREIWVVDNGSSDRTAAQAQAAARVIYEPQRGYGQACWRGLKEAGADYEWVLFCDGDGSDDLSSLPEFFAATAHADFILGNRRANPAGREALTPVQNFGNALATTLIRLAWGYRYQDLGPLRLIRRQVIFDMGMSDRSFGWTVEMQAKAAQKGIKTQEIPVNYRPRQGGKSKISGTLRGSWQAGTKILLTLGNLYVSDSKASSSFLKISAFLLLLGSLVILPWGDFQQPGVVARFWVGIGIMSLGFVVSWGIREINHRWFWGVALLTRLLLLPMYPGDDIWRYLWEGYLQNLGFSPYQFAPDNPIFLPYRTPWWELINNRDTAAIYPPLAQLGFRGLASLGPAVLIFKLAFVLADLGICGLLSQRVGFRKTLLYAWNPLVIYSFAGGGHYDSWFILPLVGAWLRWEHRDWRGSSLLIGLSVAMKWVSLPLLAFVVSRLRWGRAFLALGLGILPLTLAAGGFCSLEECPLIPTGSVFVSHGRSAEFLPSLVNLESNWPYAVPLAIVVVFLLRWSSNFITFAENYFFTLLILSPIVHAWYFTWLVPWAVVTRNWGVRLVSISAFFYFALKERQAVGIKDWMLTPLERLGLWLPLILGFWGSKKKC